MQFNSSIGLAAAVATILLAIFLYSCGEAYKSIKRSHPREDIAGWIISALCSLSLSSLILFNLYKFIY